MRQKAPEITFHFSGDSTNSKLLSIGNSDDSLEEEGSICCLGLEATIVEVTDPCSHGTKSKTETPQDAPPECCCGAISIWDNCPQQPNEFICQVEVDFDSGISEIPCCYSLPPGWTYAPALGHSNDNDDDEYATFTYNGEPGTGCSGAINAQGTPLVFVLCGFNTSAPIHYTVKLDYCQNTNAGGCVEDGSSCVKPFTSTISCGTSGVGSASVTEPFTVTDCYPNPATSSIRFDYSTPNVGVMTLTLVDMLGKTMSSSRSVVSSGDGNVTIGLSDAQHGNYYCVFDFNGERVTKRIEIK